jgi:hypothetical protein
MKLPTRDSVEKLKLKLKRFASGRYGLDDLYVALVSFALLLMMLGLFVESWALAVAIVAVLGVAAFRALSRNLPARKRENEKYLLVTRPIRTKFFRLWRRVRDFRKFRYRRCPSCKATICIPTKKGKRLIVCPRCHASFETRISFF